MDRTRRAKRRHRSRSAKISAGSGQVKAAIKLRTLSKWIQRISANGSQRAGQLCNCLRGRLVDRLSVSEKRLLKLELRNLVDALVRLGHVGSVLGIRAT